VVIIVFVVVVGASADVDVNVEVDVMNIVVVVVVTVVVIVVVGGDVFVASCLMSNSSFGSLASNFLMVAPFGCVYVRGYLSMIEEKPAISFNSMPTSELIVIGSPTLMPVVLATLTKVEPEGDG